MVANTDISFPTYGEKPNKPGMYLGLLHGRDAPAEQMNGWGFNGPMIGPLQWFHTTYTCTIRLSLVSEADGTRYFGEVGTDHELSLDGDLLVFAGKYYGDWTVYIVAPETCERPLDTFRRNERCSGWWAHSPCLS